MIFHKAWPGAILATLLFTTTAVASPGEVVLPVERYFERQTLKGFGTNTDAAFHEQHRALFPHNGLNNQYIGLHAAVDIEFYDPDGASRDIPVRAVADGEVVYLGNVDGYGGLIILRHQSPEVVTSLYGHLRLGDAKVRMGQRVAAGSELAVLGANFSPDTSGARKHLHFGIHKGPEVDVAGHENDPATLQREWHDPNAWLRHHLSTPSPSAAPAPAPAEPAKSWWRKIVDWISGPFG